MVGALPLLSSPWGAGTGCCIPPAASSAAVRGGAVFPGVGPQCPGRGPGLQRAAESPASGALLEATKPMQHKLGAATEEAFGPPARPPPSFKCSQVRDWVLHSGLGRPASSQDLGIPQSYRPALP